MIGAPLAAMTSLTVPVVASIGLTVFAIPVVLTFHEPKQVKTGVGLGYLALMRRGVSFAFTRPRLRAVIILGALFQGLAFSMIVFTQPFLAHHDVPVAAFGLLLTGLNLSAMAGALFSHRIAAHLGRRVTIYVACGLMAGAVLALGLVDAFFAFAAFAFLRFGLSTFFPIISELVNRDSPDDIRATVASMTTMGSGLTGAVVKPGMGAIADRTGVTNAFLANAVLMFTLGGLAVLAWTRASRGAPAPAGVEVEVPEPVAATEAEETIADPAV
jgi:MFS family permease